MEVCFVNPFFYPFRGGIENYMLDLSKYLVSKGHDVNVITSREKGLKKYEEIEGIKVNRVRSAVFYKLPSMLPPPYAHPIGFSYSGYKILKKINPDFIHLHNRYFPGYYPVVAFKKMMNIPLFLTIHNSRPEDINASTVIGAGLYDNVLGNRLMNQCDFIFGNSRYSLDVTVPKSYNVKRTAVTYNGIYTKDWKRVKSDMKDDFGCDQLLLTDMRIVPHKGLHYLVDALKEVDADFHLVIKGRFEASGFEYEKQIMRQIKKNKLGDRVTIMPQRLTEQEMIRLYSSADQFILPSLHEPFGIVLIQAMGTETPIVATNVGGIPEVLGDTAVMVPSRSSDALAEGIMKYVEKPSLAKKNAKRARERVVRKFDWKVVGRDVERVYEKFC
jgi:glycosyltransferase involved in cell wall biosynthesis